VLFTLKLITGIKQPVSWPGSTDKTLADNWLYTW